MKIEEYIEKHPNDSCILIGMLALILVDGWAREYDREHVEKLQKIMECHLSMRDAQIDLAESLCTSKEGDRCKANGGAPCVYQCISEQYNLPKCIIGAAKEYEYMRNYS